MQMGCVVGGILSPKETSQSRAFPEDPLYSDPLLGGPRSEESGQGFDSAQHMNGTTHHCMVASAYPCQRVIDLTNGANSIQSCLMRHCIMHSCSISIIARHRQDGCIHRMELLESEWEVSRVSHLLLELLSVCLFPQRYTVRQSQLIIIST